MEVERRQWEAGWLQCTVCAMRGWSIAVYRVCNERLVDYSVQCVQWEAGWLQCTVCAMRGWLIAVYSVCNEGLADCSVQCVQWGAGWLQCTVCAMRGWLIAVYSVCNERLADCSVQCVCNERLVDCSVQCVCNERLADCSVQCVQWEAGWLQCTVCAMRGWLIAVYSVCNERLVDCSVQCVQWEAGWLQCTVCAVCSSEHSHHHNFLSNHNFTLPCMPTTFFHWAVCVVSQRELGTVLLGLARTIYIRCIYGIFAVFLTGTSPNIRSYTVYIYGSGQPQVFQNRQTTECKPKAGSDRRHVYNQKHRSCLQPSWASVIKEMAQKGSWWWQLPMFKPPWSAAYAVCAGVTY